MSYYYTSVKYGTVNHVPVSGHRIPGYPIRRDLEINTRDEHYRLHRITVVGVSTKPKEKTK